jgi:hypothetical protein
VNRSSYAIYSPSDGSQPLIRVGAYQGTAESNSTPDGFTNAIVARPSPRSNSIDFLCRYSGKPAEAHNANLPFVNDFVQERLGYREHFRRFRDF